MRFGKSLAVLAVVLALALAAPRGARAIDITENFSLSGYLEYEFFGNVERTRPDKIDGRNEIQFHTEWIFRAGENLKAFAAPELRFDGNDEERNRIFLDEAYVDFYTEKVDWRIGKQIIAWGRADTIRPTDVWKVRDYTDFFQEEEEGIVGVQARSYWGDLTVTALWIPYFQADTLPLDNERSRFFLFPTAGVFGPNPAPPPACPLPPFPCIGNLTPGAGPYSLDYRLVDTGDPEDSAESSEGGVKFEYSYEGWDVSLSYGYLHDRIPTYLDGVAWLAVPAAPALVLSDDGVGRAVLGLAPVHRRIHMIGTDGATTFDKLGLRWEAAYFVTENRSADPASPIDNPYLRVTTGLDYTFTNLVGDQDLMVLVQYAGDVELPRKGAKNIESGANLRHFFEHGILAVAEWKFSEFLKLSGRGFVNVLNADHSIEPELEWSPADGLTLTVGATLVGGTGGKNSFFTLFEKEDRVEAAARYSF